jgi:hypothetical protein
MSVMMLISRVFAAKPCESWPIEGNVVDEPSPAGAGCNDKGWLAFEASHLYVVYLQPGKLRTGRGRGIASGGMCGKARRQRPRNRQRAAAFVG